MMFNILAVRTHKKEQDMGFFQRLKLGGLALDVARWAGDLIRQLDPAAVLAIIIKVVELERTLRGIPGAQKLAKLLAWINAEYPQLGIGEQTVANFVSALVALLNAVQVFRK